MKNINLKLFLVVIMLFSPKAVFAADIYVDAGSLNAEEDGSETKPYHTITAALAKAGSNPESSRQIYVKAGNYPEGGIVLPDNSILTGEYKDAVIIDRENLEGATVTSGKNSLIENITIRGGNYGLVIPAHKRTIIRNCSIEKTKRIGIWIKRSDRLSRNSVEVWNSVIANNYKKGVFSESRFIYLIDSIFDSNGEEGIDIRSKTNGALSNNIVSNNGEGGIETEIRSVALEIKNNTLTNNRSNGITLNNRTNGGGKIIIKNNTIANNKHYGIRCAGSKVWTKKLWKTNVKDSENSLSDNLRKNISKSCHAK